MLDPSRFIHVTSLIFSATLEPGRWQEVVTELSQASGGVKTQILGYDEKRSINLGVIAHGYDPEFRESFIDYYSTINPWACGFGTYRPGDVVPLTAYCDERSLLNTEFYSDWARPQEELIGGAGALLYRTDSCVFMIGGNIRRRDQERLEPEWQDTITQIVPILQKAWHISRAISGGVVERSVAGIINASDPGILITDDDGRVLFSNDAGEAMLVEGDPVRLDLCGKVRFLNASAEARAKAASHADCFEIASGSRTCRIHKARFNPELFDNWQLGLTLGIASECNMIIIEVLQADKMYVSSYLASKGLTRSEQNVAVAIASGKTVSEIADLRQVSVHTVRNQLKCAMSKCSVNRQAELVRLLSAVDNGLPDNIR